MFTQRVSHFVPHDHGHLIVGQLALVQDARVESYFSAWHAPSVESIAAQSN
jgi:hypothetical protein